MKVLLLTHVENLGDRGDVVQVKDGYARNYLIPRGLAKPATPSVLKAWEEEMRQKRRKIEREKKAAEQLASRLEGVTLTFTLKMGPEGKAFGAVTAADIARALAEQGLEGIKREMVRLPRSIREGGRHEVPVRLYPGVFATVVVEILPEGGGSEAPAADEDTGSAEGTGAGEERAGSPEEGADGGQDTSGSS